MGRGTPRIEYVTARRVLLDALDALRPHLDALVLVGAEAVYLRTIDRLASYQPYTTDADLVLDPARLADVPALGAAMRTAGFELSQEPGVWHARVYRADLDDDVIVPVDLIVPEQIVSTAGRRSARLAGEHGKNTARKTTGLEGALVDAGLVTITALDPEDRRSIEVSVAVEAALLVAKLHKLGERLTTPERLEPKDAGDIYRLFDALDPEAMVAKLRPLQSDDRSARVTAVGIDHGRRLFGTPGSTGVALGVEALRGILPEPTVVAVLTGYWRALEEEIL